MRPVAWAGFALALAAAGLLAGCFQPLYGERSLTGGPGVRERLSAVDVGTIPAPNGTPEARIAVEVRNALIFDLTGGAGANSPTHDLAVQLSAIRQQVIVDITTARPDVEQYGINATYTLTEIATGKPVVTGQTFARVSYDIPGQAAALRPRPRPARRREPRRQGDRRQASRRGSRRISPPARDGAAAAPVSRPVTTRHRWSRSRTPKSMPSSRGPIPARPIVLVYGPDAGLVRERAETIIRASVDDPRDPFALAHLEGDVLASEPSRLAEEAHTVPLFGGTARGLGQGRRPQLRRRRRAAGGDAAGRLPHRDRGRRSAPHRAAAHALREGEVRRGHRLLCRRRARPRRG